MLRTTAKFALYLVGAHLLFSGGLIIVDAVHGVNDQDPSFALLLLVYYMNLPSVWVLKSFGASLTPVPIVLVGTVQWALIAFTLAVLYCGARPRTRTKNADEQPTPKPTDDNDA
ncbi:MAG: hypothetical protein GY851_24170 [bacterium]|nr:hypothetical protein [bacterium]